MKFSGTWIAFVNVEASHNVAVRRMVRDGRLDNRPSAPTASGLRRGPLAEDPPFYAQEPTRIEDVQYPSVGHFLTAELNADSQQRVVTWFQKWLAAGHRANRLE